MNDQLLRSSIAEFLGTFTLVFVGAGAVAATISNEFSVVVPALAHGLILVGLIFAYGHISGAHFNPAVTAGLLVGRKIGFPSAVIYWLAQFLGAIVAALVLQLLLPFNSPLGETTGSLTESAVWTAALFEFVLTFFLVTAVYQAAAFGKAGNLAPLAIGLTLAGAILAGGAYTGASLNPARTLGPAVMAGNLAYVLPYFVGIFGGGLFAGVIHSFVLNTEDDAQE
ncbi:MAG: aquaporin [Chloroflexi bacterium]|nr:aquaporin [Chloroflexota bacterium]